MSIKNQASLKSTTSRSTRSRSSHVFFKMSTFVAVFCTGCFIGASVVLCFVIGKKWQAVDGQPRGQPLNHPAREGPSDSRQRTPIHHTVPQAQENEDIGQPTDNQTVQHERQYGSRRRCLNDRSIRVANRQPQEHDE